MNRHKNLVTLWSECVQRMEGDIEDLSTFG